MVPTTEVSAIDLTRLGGKLECRVASPVFGIRLRPFGKQEAQKSHGLCRDGHPAWPGWVGGVICTGIALAAAQPFLSRLRGRLDAETAAIGVPVIADGSALLVAVLSIVAPPIGVIAVLALLWLLYQGREGGDAKYAGLRILR